MDACQSLPREWIHGTTCPVCGGISLDIERQAAAPDQFVCSTCSSAFEVATNGLHVRLVIAPAAILKQTCGEWMAPASVRRIVYESTAANQGSSQPALLPTHDVDDLLAKATQLHKLGNPIPVVAQTLRRSFGATDEQIAAITGELTAAMERHQRASLNSLMIIFACLVLIGGLLAFFLSPLSASAKLLLGFPAVNTEKNPAGPATEYLDEADLPAPLRALIPQGARLVKPLDVVIKNETPTGATSRCPSTTGEAARLFGGDMQSWTKSDNGWYLITTQPVTIRVPEGMYGGYFVFVHQPEMSNVIGPVVMENVNFVAISCR